MKWVAAVCTMLSMFGCSDGAPPSRPGSPGEDGSDQPAPATATYVRARYEVTIDPVTHSAQATIVATARAGDAAATAFAWTIDRGMTSVTATVGGVPATVSDVVAGPFRTIVIVPAKPVPPHAEVDVEAHYGGTLACESPAPLQGTCDFNPAGMSRIGTGSVFPMLITEGALPRGPQTIVVRVPAGDEVVMTTDRVIERRIEGDTAVVTGGVTHAWAMSPHVVFGKLSSVRLVDGPIPIVFHHEVGDTSWDERLAEWIPRVMTFVTARMGRDIPCQELHLIKWPDPVTDAGQAMICMIALRDLHEQTGPSLFEEGWAHEIGHEWFGGEVLPDDVGRQKMLTEGLATRLGYAYRLVQSAPADVDEYWASRTHDVGLSMRYLSPATRDAAVRVASPDQAVTLAAHGFVETFSWEYLKTTAALDLLALDVGEGAFWDATADYLDACSFGACTVDDFRHALEVVAGRDLSAQFETWVEHAPEQAIAVGFTSTPTRVDVALFRAGAAIPAPLELWIELANGQRRREHVVLGDALTQVSFDVGSPVRSVRLNPRYESLLDLFSAVPGDVNFDGVAGADDVAHCAALVGKKVSATFPPGGGISFLGIDPAFDRRCDTDASGEITAADVGALAPDLAPRARDQ